MCRMVVQSVCVFQVVSVCAVWYYRVCVCFRLSLYGSTECVCVSGLSLYVPYGSTECVCVSGCLCMCCMVVQRVCVFQVVSVCAVW